MVLTTIILVYRLPAADWPGGVAFDALPIKTFHNKAFHQEGVAILGWMLGEMQTIKVYTELLLAGIHTEADPPVFINFFKGIIFVRIRIQIFFISDLVKMYSNLFPIFPLATKNKVYSILPILK